MAHPNPQNLRVPTSEEARINGAKGGKASVEARKRKKTMMDLLDKILTEENKDPSLGKSLKKLGFDETDNYHMARIVAAILRKAEDGDLKAADMILKMLYGDSQNVNVNIEGNMEMAQRVHIYLPQRDEEPE